MFSSRTSVYSSSSTPSRGGSAFGQASGTAKPRATPSRSSALRSSRPGAAAYSNAVMAPSRAAEALSGGLPSSSSALSTLDLYRPTARPTALAGAVSRPTAAATPGKQPPSPTPVSSMVSSTVSSSGGSASPRPVGQKVERALTVRTARDLRSSAGAAGNPGPSTAELVVEVSAANSTLAGGRSLESRKRQGERLRDAATRGDVRGINDLLAQGARANEADAYGDTALHKAAQYGHVLVVDALINGLADVNLGGYYGRTALHDGAIHGHLRVADKLLSAGAIPTFQDKHGRTARDCAQRSRRMDLVRLFDEYSPEPETSQVKEQAAAVPSSAPPLQTAAPAELSGAAVADALMLSGSPEGAPSASAMAARRMSYPPKDWSHPGVETAVSTELMSPEQVRDQHAKYQEQRAEIMRHKELSPMHHHGSTSAWLPLHADVEPEPAEPPRTASSPVRTRSTTPRRDDTAVSAEQAPEPEQPLLLEVAEQEEEAPPPPRQPAVHAVNRTSGLYQTIQAAPTADAVAAAAAGGGVAASLRKALEEERLQHRITKEAAERSNAALKARVGELEQMLKDVWAERGVEFEAPGGDSGDPNASAGGFETQQRTGSAESPKCVLGLTPEQQAEAAVFLSEVPLMKAFSEEELQQLTLVVQLSEYDESDLIVEQGAPGDSCHFLYSGNAQAEKDGEVVWSGYSHGDFFGELALLEDRPRAASIRAVGGGGTKCFTMGREDFQRVVGLSAEILQERQQAYDAASPAVPSLPLLAPVASAALPSRSKSTMQLNGHRTPIARKPRAPRAPARLDILPAMVSADEVADVTALYSTAQEPEPEPELEPEPVKEPWPEPEPQPQPQAVPAAPAADEDSDDDDAAEEEEIFAFAEVLQDELDAMDSEDDDEQEEEEAADTGAIDHAVAPAVAKKVLHPPEILSAAVATVAPDGGGRGARVLTFHESTDMTPSDDEGDEPQPQPQPQPEPERKPKARPPPLPSHVTAASPAGATVRARSSSREDWGKMLQQNALELEELAAGVEQHAEALDKQLEEEVAPDLVRYQQLLQLILSGRATEADNIEMERLSAVLNLDEDDGS